MRVPDARETLAGAIDFAKQNDDLVHLDLEVAEALALELRRIPDPALLAAWAHRGKLRSVAASFAKAVKKHGDAVVRLAPDREDGALPEPQRAVEGGPGRGRRRLRAV
jgi:hypothetical protein